MSYILYAVFGSKLNNAARASSHRHMCTFCSFVWEHSDSKKGCKEAHKCPRCKKQLTGGWPQLTPELMQDYIKRGIIKTC